MKNYVAYVRVSTARQGVSGLGLEAQVKTVRDHIGGEPVEWYQEVESGRRKTRPQLQAALEACKKHDAVLIVAKLDRLARDASLILQIRNSGAKVVFCDMPETDGPFGDFIVTVMAAFAEMESGLISQRTKAAMAAAKAQGRKFGDDARGELSNRNMAAKRAKELAPIIAEIREGGATSLHQLAEELNLRKIETPNGAKWYPTTVSRVLERLSA